jgi:hypothetical protein
MERIRFSAADSTGTASDASFNLGGSRIAVIESSSADEAKLFLYPVPALSPRKPVQLPGTPVASAWAPDDVRIALLLAKPSSLVVYESGLETSTSPVALPGTPRCLAWLPNARELIIGTDRELGILDLAGNRWEAFSGSTNVVSVSLNEAGSLVIVLATNSHLLGCCLDVTPIRLTLC